MSCQLSDTHKSKLTYNICNIAGNAHNNTSDAGNKKFHSTDPIVLPGIIKDFSKI
jgi:hypothetical protein